MLKLKFTACYADKVKEQFEKGIALEEVRVDLKLSMMKEVEAIWIVSAYDYIKSNKNIIQNGFKKAGISDAIENPPQVEEEQTNAEDTFCDLD